MGMTNQAVIRAIWDPSAAKSGISETKRDVQALGQQAAGTLKEAWSRVGGLKGIFGIAAAAEAFLILKQQLTDLVKDTAAEERGMARLGVTLRNIGKENELASVTSLFGELQKQTAFADDQVAQAFQTLIQGTGDYAESRKYLMTVLDASVALDRDVASSAQLVSMVLEGNNRAVGIAVPQMRSFAASLEDIADPAERARMMMEKLQSIVGGQAESDTKTLAGATARLKNNWGELMQTLLVNTGVLDATTKGIEALTKGVVKLQESAAGNDPSTWASFKYTHQLMPMKPPAPLPAQYDSPIGPMTKEEYDAWYNSLRFGPITESAFGENPWLPANTRMRGGPIKGIQIDPGTEQIAEYTKRWQEAGREIREAQQKDLDALAATWAGFFEGAFTKLKTGWRGTVDYMRDYIEQALIRQIASQLGNMFARSAVSSFFGFITGGGGGGGGGGMVDSPIGGGGGPMITQARGAAIATLQRRASRLGW